MNWIKDDSIPSSYIKKIAKLLNIKELLAKIILKRNNNEDFLKNITISLERSIIPAEKLYNAKNIAKKIAWYIENNSYIFIHADYDSDGVNSGKIIYSVIDEIIKLRKSSSKVEVYFPERKNGYGLSFYFCNNLLKDIKDEKYKNFKKILVITVDNGISQVEEVKLLKNNNIETLVIDHHESKEKIPDCLICDPHNHHVKQDDTFKHLCGAGVTFKVCELLQKEFNFHDMIEYVPYVGIATVTDMMPLNDENIAFIKYALEILNSKECPNNYKAMIKLLKSNDIITTDKVLPANLGWDIGPRLNSCGRMGHTNVAGKFILSEEYSDSIVFAREIENFNSERKEITNKIKKHIKEKCNFDDDLFIIYVIEEAPEGIAGIICSFIATEYKKPCIVVNNSKDVYVGSARTVSGINILELLKNEYNNGLLIKYGGHKDAAGVTFKQSNLNMLKMNLNKQIKNLIESNIIVLDSDSKEEDLIIDDEIKLCQINKENFELINQIPYNNSNFKEPIFSVKNCQVKYARTQASNEKNMWLTLCQEDGTEIEFWCRNLTAVYVEIGCPDCVDIAGKLKKNFMQGKREYTLEIIDIKESNIK